MKLQNRLSALYFRTVFVFKYKTLRKMRVTAAGRLTVYTPDGIFTIPRFCPHQGAPLENGYLKGSRLVCHWHGCNLDVPSRRWTSTTNCYLNIS